MKMKNRKPPYQEYLARFKNNELQEMSEAHPQRIQLLKIILPNMKEMAKETGIDIFIITVYLN